MRKLPKKKIRANLAALNRKINSKTNHWHLHKKMSSPRKKWTQRSTQHVERQRLNSKTVEKKAWFLSTERGDLRNDETSVVPRRVNCNAIFQAKKAILFPFQQKKWIQPMELETSRNNSTNKTLCGENEWNWTKNTRKSNCVKRSYSWSRHSSSDSNVAVVMIELIEHVDDTDADLQGRWEEENDYPYRNKIFQHHEANPHIHQHQYFEMMR